MNKPKVYIAGPVSGMPNSNKEAFAKATKTFRDAGHIVVNPLELCHDLKEEEWQKCMKRCIVALMDCELIILLEGWNKSTGATIEYQLAVKLGMETCPIGIYNATIGQ
jgi:hypothetical protein